MTKPEAHFKFSFKIEPKSEGGFIARSENPPCTLEGGTREEVDGKIREKVGELLGPEIAAKLEVAGNLQFGKPGVHVEKKISFSIGKQAETTPALTEMPGAAPARPDSFITAATVVKLLIAIGILLLIWRLLPHR